MSGCCPIHKHKVSFKMRQELKAELLPKIKLVQSHKLLSRPKHFPNSQSASTLPFLIENDITSKELLETTEWIDTDDEKSSKDLVKRLEHWTYNKKLHQENDTEYRKVLRARISKQIASTGEELFNSEETKSYIVATISQQLAAQKEKDNTNRKKDARVLSSLASMELSGLFSTSALVALKKFEGTFNNARKDAGRLKKVDNELAMELQTLRMKKELTDRKKELKRLFSVNNSLVLRIEDEKHNIEMQLARRHTVSKADTVSLSTTRSKPRRGIIYHSGTSGVVQELHNRHIEVIKEKERTQVLIANYEKNIEKCKKEYDDNLGKIHNLEYEIEQIRPEIDSNVKKQIDYYYSLLEEGTDTRNVGLGWIVKTLHYLERKFPSSALFPKFLEEDTMGCILRVAALELQKEKLEKSLRNLTQVKRKDSLKKNEKEIFVTPLPESLTIPTMNSEEGPKYSLKNRRQISMSMISNSRNSTSKQVKDAEEVQIEEKIAKIAQEIKELKKNEITRIGKTFIKKTLQGKQADPYIAEILSAIVGEYEGAKEYAKILKNREELLKSWEKNVSFVFVKPIKKKKKKLIVILFESNYKL